MAMPDNVVQLTLNAEAFGDINDPPVPTSDPAADAISVLDSLASQLERATGARDEAFAELERARHFARTQVEALVMERDTALKTRDALIPELEQLRSQIGQQRSAFELNHETLSRGRQEIADQLAKERAEHERRLATVGQTADDFTKKLADVSEQFARTQKSLEERIETLKTQREQADLDRLTGMAEAERQRHALQREIEELKKSGQKTEAQRDELADEIAETKRETQKQLDALTKERDQLQQAGENLRAQIAEVTSGFEQLKGEAAGVRAELAQWRAAYERDTTTLTGERDKLAADRAELRELRDLARLAHDREIHARQEQIDALAAQRDQASDQLSQDQTFYSTQLNALTRERDMVAMERNETRAALAAHTEAHGREFAVVTAERNAVVEQRDEAWRQLERCREAHRQQLEAIRLERDSLIEQRSDSAAQLSRFTAALGEDRMAGLREQSDAIRQLSQVNEQQETARQEYQRQLEEIAEERDQALAQLAPFTAMQQIEQETFGAATTRKYEVRGRVSTERTGTLVRAVDGITEREVIMKVAESTDGSPAIALRELLREARTLARLDHPGILPLYEIGVDESGRPFYTTRAVEGVTLRQILDEIEQGRTGTSIHFTLRRMLAIFQRACDAVAYAHAQNIVHGGLEAKNVLIGDYGEVFITGWGAEGNAIYAESRPSPEHDVRALGQILFEIVTLAKPPDATQLARESLGSGKPNGSQKKSVAAKPSRAPEPFLRRHQALATIVLRAAEKAIGRHGGRSHFTVRELQREVDAYSSSFDDPTERMTVGKVVARLVMEQKWFFAALAIVLLTVIAWFGSLVLKMHPFRAGWMHEVLTHENAAAPQPR
ncbi:MAG: eukaryotic-like serine/threonine-protein kinase [Chthoniobacter sp.]|nr:eukaryotic-like serine/threonine-protein kinase [Chthoniobacter sp.]